MTPAGRTNQLIYQAELLLQIPHGDDEHANARRMATEEGAMAVAELALNSALRELTEHAMLARHDWRELLTGERPLAELEHLRELARREDSWLAWLLARLAQLHDVDGAAGHRQGGAALIVTAGEADMAERLRWCLREFKSTLAELRETSFEW
ncbi:DUF6586 family protein [Aidingimonas halophila]|uniref:Uncharacterized protein n=1 Tax=Aidingimonas halophila TaxID=574349 RepID=A0A1H3D1C0_9GAMM|nr:DUF6586 family protein [Aidingimonas halophila]GHC30675.1 hypothetical protein GCM10008094_23820 [Aidingimonas halophila]SDX60273.1 hypothetical protein SAMN05443545_106165 [Aidingimonas halophila]